MLTICSFSVNLEPTQFKMYTTDKHFKNKKHGYTSASFTDTELKYEVVVAESPSQHPF